MKTDGSNYAGGKGLVAQGATLSSWLKEREADIKSVIPAGTVDKVRFMQQAYLTIYDPKSPLLARCTPVSLLKCLKEAATLGLEVGGVLGQAYFIPYEETMHGRREMTCHLQIGYKGLIALARRSHTVKTICAEAVHENDFFEAQMGTGRKIDHRFSSWGDRGDVVGYYCLVELNNGGQQFVIMSRQEIQAHRDKFSKVTGEGSVWNKNFDAMAKKTVIIQTLKLCPISVEDLRAIEEDEAALEVEAKPAITPAQKAAATTVDEPPVEWQVVTDEADEVDEPEAAKKKREPKTKEAEAKELEL